MLPVVPYKKQLSWYIDSRTESERRQAAYAAESAPSYVHLPQLGARPCVGDGCTETLQAAYVCVSIFPLPDGGSTGHPPGVSGHRGCARATYVGDERAGAPPLTLAPYGAPGASSRTARGRASPGRTVGSAAACARQGDLRVGGGATAVVAM